MNTVFVGNRSIFCCCSRPSVRLRSHAPLSASPFSIRNPRGSGKRIRAPRCSMDVSLGGCYSYDKVPTFPRMNVWDPHKLLGVSRDASEEEIRGARNFLLEQYAAHERSVESIEEAYEKILMKSFEERKKSKINLKSRLTEKVEESPSCVKTLLSYVELPSKDIILRRLFLFVVMAVWSVTHSAENGPAFQVLLSLGSCIYFLNDKMKSLIRAMLTGLGTLVVGWTVGSVLVPMLPWFLLQSTWTLELLTSLVCYVFLFLSCTFLK